MWLGILVAVIYGAVAVAANFVNKYAVQVLPLPTTILLLQTLTTVMVLRTMASLQILRLPSLRALRVRQLFPLSMCRAVHAVLVLYSLAFLSVPMYNVLKRLTPVMVLTMKGLLDKRWPDVQTTSAVLLIVSGCFVAGAGDLHFASQGYVIALICAVSQAVYILLAERASAAANRKQHDAAAGAPDVEGKPDVEVKSADVGRSLDQTQKQPGSQGGGVQPSPFRNGQAVNGWAHESSSAWNGSAPGAVMAGKHLGSKGGGLRDLLGRLYALADVRRCLPGPHEAESAEPLTTTDLLYSICVISLPPLAVVCVMSGEAARAPRLLETLQEVMGPTSFAVWLGITAVTEGLLTGSVILCTSMNSALTTSIVGVLKGAVSSVLGFFLLGGVKFHIVNVAGISLNMAGGVWYTAAQYVKKKGKGGGSAALGA